MTEPSKNQKRRAEIVAAAAAHLVAHGFANSGIRAIARTAGMSDRMIMYYFETKDDLVAEALELVAEQLAAGMDAAVPKGGLTPRQVLDALAGMLKSEEVQAVMRLWFEIVGLAMRGQEPYRRIAAELVDQSEAQIAAKLRTDQKHRAGEVLASLEGGLMIALLSN
ncbi:MAG: TetR/AcrR family transcriptional regulator [Pseudomonadota bacterium]